MEVGCLVKISGLRGVVRYIGPSDTKPGTWIGIELEKPKGKNNGTIGGKKYFNCKEMHGLFANINDFYAAKGVVEDVANETLPRSQSLGLKKKSSASGDLVKNKTDPLIDISPNNDLSFEKLVQEKNELEEKIISLQANSEKEIHELKYRLQNSLIEKKIENENERIGLLEKIMNTSRDNEDKHNELQSLIDMHMDYIRTLMEKVNLE